jgi:hypothetical protein
MNGPRASLELWRAAWMTGLVFTAKANLWKVNSAGHIVETKFDIVPPSRCALENPWLSSKSAISLRAEAVSPRENPLFRPEANRFQREDPDSHVKRLAASRKRFPSDRKTAFPSRKIQNPNQKRPLPVGTNPPPAGKSRVPVICHQYFIGEIFTAACGRKCCTSVARRQGRWYKYRQPGSGEIVRCG